MPRDDLQGRGGIAGFEHGRTPFAPRDRRLEVEDGYQFLYFNSYPNVKVMSAVVVAALTSLRFDPTPPGAMLADVHDNETSTMLSALAHEVRYAAMGMLVAAGSDGISAGELAKRLETAPSNMSFHMSALTAAGLVTSKRQGQSVVYHAEDEAIDRLLSKLATDLRPRSTRS